LQPINKIPFLQESDAPVLLLLLLPALPPYSLPASSGV
jgi:hypothetical protein